MCQPLFTSTVLTCNPHNYNGEIWVSSNSYITLFFFANFLTFFVGFSGYKQAWVTSNPRKNYIHVMGYPMRHWFFLYFLWGKHLQWTYDLSSVSTSELNGLRWQGWRVLMNIWFGVPTNIPRCHARSQCVTLLQKIGWCLPAVGQ